MKKLPAFRPSRDHITMTDINGKRVRAKITKRVTLRQRTSHRGKYFVLEEIKLPKKRRTRTQLRVGYWILGKKPRMRNKWVWGQSAPLIPKSDLLKLVDKAKRQGML